MFIKSICTSKVITIQKSATLLDAVSLMQVHHVGSIVAVEFFEGKLIPAGIITDRDIALTMGSSQKPSMLKVEHIMQSAPVTIREDQGINEAILRMQEYGVTRLPVIKEDGTLVGIVSKDDILELMGDEITNLAKIKENEIKNEQGVKLPVERHL